MGHISIIQGDFVFYGWKENAAKEARKKEHTLRTQGYRKVNQFVEGQEMYTVYRKKKKFVTVTFAMV